MRSFLGLNTSLSGRMLLTLILMPVVLYLALCTYYLRQDLRANGGHFVYALDDPYIHLALATEIAHGHYGIDTKEASSPSSSLLWPFLLAPFATANWFLWVPLALNVFFGILLAGLLGWVTACWPGWDNSADEFFRRGITGLALVFIANLVGLAFVGMEHTLQVLLAFFAALAVLLLLQGRRVPAIVLVLVGLSPSVRYEGLGLVLAVALGLVVRRDYRRAAFLAVGSVAPLALFSLYLRSLGLPLLPISVLVKGGAAQGGALARIWALAVRSVAAAITRGDRLLLLLLFLIIADLALQQRNRARSLILAAAAAAAGLHLLIGQFNWLNRYEVYIVCFCVLVVLQLAFEAPRSPRGWYALGLLACAYPYLNGLRSLTAASQDIYLQQYQMRRFTADFYKGNVAVNDLGLVSYQRPAGQHVADLLGLGSLEAAQQKEKTAAWMQTFTVKHDARVAIIYKEWFPNVPASWIPLGSLCLARPAVMLAHDCVEFYATSPKDSGVLQREFNAFALTVPEGDLARPASPSRSDAP